VSEGSFAGLPSAVEVRARRARARNTTALDPGRFKPKHPCMECLRNSNEVVSGPMKFVIDFQQVRSRRERRGKPETHLTIQPKPGDSPKNLITEEAPTLAKKDPPKITIRRTESLLPIEFSAAPRLCVKIRTSPNPSFCEDVPPFVFP
jgi:hypothetical protein